MIARTHGETNRPETVRPKRTSPAETTLNFTALGCLVAGIVGIIKAVEMQRATDGLLCVLGSLAACVLVCYLYFRNG
jgi:UDP-N-acetylmuramyl pentapeptide phosphotransferase/UDP-N-acetylglucosamine-1-phosphate transferase